MKKLADEEKINTELSPIQFQYRNNSVTKLGKNSAKTVSTN